jgi:RNA polymerase sigma-70 factor (ECF subfamily)
MRNKEEVVKLFQQMKKGSREAMDEIITIFSEDVFKSAFDIVQDEQDAKDIAQEVFMNLWLKRETLHIEQPRPYLSKAAMNGAFDLLKKKKNDRLKHLDASWHQDTMETQAEHDELLLDKDLERKGLLLEAISKMSKKQAHAFTEIRINGKTPKEVAESEKVQLSTINKHLQRAYRIVKKFIKKNS